MADNKRTLLLIADLYPFEFGETFLYPEIEILKEKFNITVVSIDVHSDLAKEYHENFKIFRIDCSLTLFQKIFFSLCFFLEKNSWKELMLIYREKDQLFSKLKDSVAMFAVAKKFSRYFNNNNVSLGQNIIYCYWHDAKALGIAMLKEQGRIQEVPIVTRIHGGDLFNERIPAGKRQPFKWLIDRNLTALYFASNHGYEYYHRTFGFTNTCHYAVSRLGVRETGHITSTSHTPGLSILSVSNAIPLKRIELIIAALALVSDFSINWTHLGDGPDLGLLKSLAEKKLSTHENVTYAFKGAVSNPSVIQYYQEHEVDVFITTTSTEGGCPVSIQEAFSFGVPAIGTAVGGISEMIDNAVNGFLLSEDPSPQEILEYLVRIHTLKTAGDLGKMKQHALDTWKEHFDAKKNFQDFCSDLLHIVEKQS